MKITPPHSSETRERPAISTSGRPEGESTRSLHGILRAGWFVLAVGFVGFLVWASFSKLDSGVTAVGEIVVDSQRQKIQHLNGGIVDEVLVRDGDHVARGQILVRLNKTRIQSELGVLRAQLLSAQAIEARLSAERKRASSFELPPSVAAALADPRIAEVAETQAKLFATRSDAIRNEQSILDETIRGQTDQIAGVRALLGGKERQHVLLTDELTSLRSLYEEGYVPRVRIYELERAVTDIEARRLDDAASIARLHASINELKLRKLQREQEYFKEVDTQLAAIQREVNGLEQRLVGLQDELERTDIRAPAGGVVVGLRINTTGGVVRAGEDILDLVPDGVPLVIEARVPTQSIELVHVGLDSLVRFSALSRLNPVVQGRVTSVSADRLTEERSGLPYYKVRIDVPPEQLARLEYERIVPGMPAEVVIKTGEFTVLHYLLKPLLDHVFLAFRER